MKKDYDRLIDSSNIYSPAINSHVVSIMFSLRALRCFVAVAEDLHFGSAAARLHMTQPPLSQQIKQLEDSLGTALFVRSTRTVQLTAAGSTLLPRARALLADADATRDTVIKAGRGAVGTLNLGFAASAAHQVLPKALSCFTSRFPEVSLNLKEMLSSDLLSALRSRKLDVILARMTPAMLGPDISCVVVLRERIVLAMPRDDPLGAQSSPIDIRLLENKPFIGFSAGESGYFRERLDEILSTRNVKPRIMHESVFPTILALVEAKLGVALVPESFTGMRADHLTYRQLMGIEGAHMVELHCAWRNDVNDQLVANFVDIVHTLDAGPT